MEYASNGTSKVSFDCICGKPSKKNWQSGDAVINRELFAFHKSGMDGILGLLYLHWTALSYFLFTLLRGLRPSSLEALSASESGEMKNDGKDVLFFIGAIGCRNGSMKTDRGGHLAAREKPQQLVIWKPESMYRTLCRFGDIKEYLAFREGLRSGIDRLFLEPNVCARHRLGF